MDEKITPETTDPNYMQAIVASYARKGLTVLATFLLTKGCVQSGDITQDTIELWAGIIAMLASVWWSHKNTKKVVTAVAEAQAATVVAVAKSDTATADLKEANQVIASIKPGS